MYCLMEIILSSNVIFVDDDRDSNFVLVVFL